jgi:subtilase family serine protease
MAHPVTVRCTVDGLTVDTDQIGVIEPLSLETAQCEWAISGSGNVTLSIEIDWTDEIDETNEVNNLISYPLVVEPGVENPGTPSDASESESKGDGNSKMLWGGLIIVGLFGLALLQLGPGRIRRIE